MTDFIFNRRPSLSFCLCVCSFLNCDWCSYFSGGGFSSLVHKLSFISTPSAQRQGQFPLARDRRRRAFFRTHAKSMARPPAIQWYYKQWLGDNKVLAMDWDARGMHFHLLMMSIQEEPAGSLPDDMAAIRRWLNLPSGSVDFDGIWRRVKPQIFAAWTLRDGRWFNSGMVETMERQQRYKERYEEGTKSLSELKKKKIKSSNKNQSSLFDEEEVSKSLDPQVEEIGHQHPANAHLKSLPLPDIQRQAIAEAIERDGFENVLSGTRKLAERVISWPTSDLRFVPNPVKFYQEAQYLKNPAIWERKKDNGSEECTLHPESGRTQWGTCWGCYATRYSTECESA
jgi:hypothetical protein